MSFIGFIPIHVRHNNKLNPRDKVVYSEITANLNEDGICVKNNVHFANVLNCTKTTISACMTSLRQAGFIYIVIEKDEVSKKFIKRYIMPLPYTNLQGGGNDELKKAMLNFQGGGEPVSADISTLNNSDTPNKDEATINSIKYITSISKIKKIKLNKSINDKQLAFLKKIVSDFYTIKRKQLPKYISENWFEDTNLTNGAVNVLFELITEDDWEDKDVRDVINWATTDSFWILHLLSLRTLRDKSKNGLTKFANLHLKFKG